MQKLENLTEVLIVTRIVAISKNDKFYAEASKELYAYRLLILYKLRFLQAVS